MARYTNAIWRPTSKHGYPGNDTHLHQGLVIHSAEGSLAGLFSVLDGTREASWHFSVAQDGRVYQHIDTDRIAWTNGSQEANGKFWGIECEGGGPGSPGEPLTEPQYQSLASVVWWLWETHGLTHYERRQTLWEHNEMTRFGAASTSCPSGRIPWDRLMMESQEDDMPTIDEIRAVVKAEVQAERKTTRMYLRSLSRYLRTGQVGTINGNPNDPDDANFPISAERDKDIADVLDAIANISAGGDGPTPDVIKEAMKEAQREGTG